MRCSGSDACGPGESFVRSRTFGSEQRLAAPATFQSAPVSAGDSRLGAKSSLRVSRGGHRWAHCVRSLIATKRLWRRRSLGRLRSRTRGGGCVVTGTVQRRRCLARTHACDGARVSVHVAAAPEQHRRRHPSRKSRSCDSFLGGSGLGASGLGGRGSSPSSGTRGLRSIGCGVYLPRTR